MNWKSLLFVLALAMLVAGCTAPQSPIGGSSGANGGGSTPGDGSSGLPSMGEASVSITDIPSEVLIGKPIVVKWHLDGSGDVPHTAIHWGTKSHADVAIADMSTQTYPSAAPVGYLTGSAPGDFSASITVDEPITIYLRAHAIVAGQSVWTEEKAVKIVTKLASTGMATSDASTPESDGSTPSTY